MHACNIPLHPIYVSPVIVSRIQYPRPHVSRGPNEQRIGFPCFCQLKGHIFYRVYIAKLKKKKKTDTDLPLCKIDERSCIQICSSPKTTGR